MTDRSYRPAKDDLRIKDAPLYKWLMRNKSIECNRAICVPGHKYESRNNPDGKK